MVALRSDIDALPLPDREGRPVPVGGPGRVPRVRPRRAYRGPTGHSGSAGRARGGWELAGDRSGCSSSRRKSTCPADHSSVIANCGDARRRTGLRAALRSADRRSVRSGCEPVRSRRRAIASRCALSGPGGHTRTAPPDGGACLRAGPDHHRPARFAQPPRRSARPAVLVVWASVQAGQAGNAIPSSGVVRGTIRLLDRSAWDGAEDIVRTLRPAARRADRCARGGRLPARRPARRQ